MEETKGRSLEWTDSTGRTYHYYKDPLRKACMFILIQEACERLAYYSIQPTMQKFLTSYLGISQTEANSLMSLFGALCYFTPLVSAVVADTWLGAFMTILVFSGVYLAGMLLLTLSAIDSISQPWMIYVALMVLISIGSGGIKSCVNVMGAAQFHPTEQQAQLTRFFTFFYAAINVGALIGIGTVPVMIQEMGSYFYAYLVPLMSFILATVVFVMGSSRYVKMKPQGSQVVQILKVLYQSVRSLTSLETQKESNGGRFKDQFIEDTRSLGYLLPLFSLIIPFCVGYGQMCTAFYTQATKMNPHTFGWRIPVEEMQLIDPLAVVGGSFLVEYLYAFLRSKSKMPSVLTRFFIGNMLGAASLLCAVGVERSIMASPDPRRDVSVWLQTPQFALIALGEIFLISTAYEIAFTYSPESLKAVGSALNLLFMAMASFISAALFKAFANWMPDYKPEDPATWTTCKFDYYFLFLTGICVLAGLGSLAMKPYFKRNIKKPSERQKTEIIDKSCCETSSVSLVA